MSDKVTATLLGAQAAIGTAGCIVVLLIFPLSGWGALILAVYAVLGAAIYGSGSRDLSGVQKRLFQIATLLFLAVALVLLVELLG